VLERCGLLKERSIFAANIKVSISIFWLSKYGPYTGLTLCGEDIISDVIKNAVIDKVSPHFLDVAWQKL